eukprot:162182_1
MYCGDNAICIVSCYRCQSASFGNVTIYGWKASNISFYGTETENVTIIADYAKNITFSCFDLACNNVSIEASFAGILYVKCDAICNNFKFNATNINKHTQIYLVMVYPIVCVFTVLNNDQ